MIIVYLLGGLSSISSSSASKPSGYSKHTLYMYFHLVVQYLVQVFTYRGSALLYPQCTSVAYTWTFMDGP